MSSEGERDLAERLTIPAKVLLLSSLLIGGLGFWLSFEVLAETNLGFPMLAPWGCGAVSCVATLGLGRLAFKLLGVAVWNDAQS